MNPPQLKRKPLLTVAGLFAGVGAIELGFRRAGLGWRLLCEIDPAAAHILRRPSSFAVSIVFVLREGLTSAARTLTHDGPQA